MRPLKASYGVAPSVDMTSPISHKTTARISVKWRDHPHGDPNATPFSQNNRPRRSARPRRLHDGATMDEKPKENIFSRIFNALFKFI